MAVAAGRFAPGHLGELTQVVPFEMVDAVLAETGSGQVRVRDLPARVVVYLLLAAGLFAEIGYGQVWARLVSGLSSAQGGAGLVVATPGSSALAQARRRVGPRPLAALFALLAGPGASTPRWRGLLVCAIDGTTMAVPDSAANLTRYARQSGPHGGSGYPLLRLVAVVACGSRTVLGAVFGPIAAGEIRYAERLLGCLHPGILLLGDRNFAARDLIGQIGSTGADLLIRCKDNRRLPAIGRCGDGSWLARLGELTVRVIEAEIIVVLDGERRTGRYKLITTLTDPAAFCALDLVALYHQRWEIELCYLELKSTTLGGRVLRARTPAGIEQEVYAAVLAYQVLRLAVADALAASPRHPGQAAPAPDRASFTIALHAARDQIIHASAVIAGTTIDLVGAIGRAVLAGLLPPRRARLSPRVVKRAISKHRAKGDIDRASHHITKIHINVTHSLTTDPGP